MNLTNNFDADIHKWAENEFEMNKMRYYNQVPTYQFPAKQFAKLEIESGDIAEKLFREADDNWIDKAKIILRQLEAEFIKIEPAYKEWCEQNSLEQDFNV